MSLLWITLSPFLIIAAVLVIYPLWDVSSKAKKYDYSSKHPSFFTPELIERFPTQAIYYVPPVILEIYRLHGKKNSRYHEYDPEQYDNILSWYPKAPRTSGEQAEGEVSFWRMYAQFFSITPQAGTIELRPEQEIINYFEYQEKWILRRYFAATGNIEKCSIEEECRLTLRIMLATADEKREREREKDNFLNYTLPRYVEQMGGWFCQGVKRAFREMNEPVGKLPAKPVTDEDGEPVVY